MNKSTRKRLLYLSLPLLGLLHGDFWWWDDASLLLGLPIGLSYHILFCLAVSLVMWRVVGDGLTPDSGSEPIAPENVSSGTDRQSPS